MVGSGITAENLAEGNLAIALLANAIATGGIRVLDVPGFLLAELAGAAAALWLLQWLLTETTDEN